ncbi:hypothetical protein BS50DRAFT_367819 [Corynespora cassiicola Philippines]|uniref:Uncharacterized protein n=1 Tax=Corynespora cassiicola Philippines TaxID=1448308 RepID=A0A2T2N098_CORCC|nr:hypothetical protein BS50DRAFT_367819 [Corynespora cassiicola Philippines]
MDFTEKWLIAVLDASGDLEEPPDQQIPADYLQKPLRQHPASTQTNPSSSLLPSPPTSFTRSKRSHAALSEIEPPNHEPPPKRRRRTPNAPSLVMSQALRSPSKRSSRVAARKAKDTNIGSTVEDLVDPNTTPRPVRAKRKPAPGPPVPIVPVPNLDETQMPALTPSASEGELDIPRYDMDRPTSSITESTGSRARSRSPTKRMVDLRVAEKTVALKTVKSPADVPGDVREVYKAIQSLARVPRGVIPLGIEVRANPLLSLLSLLTFLPRMRFKRMPAAISTIWTFS